MKVTGLHHISIRSRDFDRSMDFYTRLLGLKPKVRWQAAPQRAIMLDAGDGNYIELFERPNEEAAGATRGMNTGADVVLHLAIRVDDVAAWLEKLRGEGFHVAMEMKDVKIPNTEPGLPGEVPVRIAFVNGPDGELIELFENELT